MEKQFSDVAHLVQTMSASPEFKFGKIFDKVVQISKDVGAIAKKHRNQQQSFNYRGIDDVYDNFHTHFHEKGVVCIPRQVGEIRSTTFPARDGKFGFRMEMNYIFRLFSSEDGSFVDIGPVVGEAHDYADKAANKALSVTMKYAFWIAFMVPLNNVFSDPDGDSINRDSSGKPAQAAPKNNQQRPASPPPGASATPPQAQPPAQPPAQPKKKPQITEEVFEKMKKSIEAGDITVVESNINRYEEPVGANYKAMINDLIKAKKQMLAENGGVL